MVANIADRATRDQKVTELLACRSSIRAHLSRYRLIYPGAIGKIETGKLFNDQFDLIHVPRPWPVAIYFLQRNDIRVTYCFYNAMEVHLLIAPATKLDVIGNYLQSLVFPTFFTSIWCFYTLSTLYVKQLKGAIRIHE